MTIDKMIDKLHEIKGDRSYRAMAREANMEDVTLWRIMNGQRAPSAESMMALMGAYPELARVFLPDNVPSGTSDSPSGSGANDCD